MKRIIFGAFIVIGITMCQYAPAQTTQIVTPDGRLITCIKSGQLISCF